MAYHRYPCCIHCAEEHDADDEIANNHDVPCLRCGQPEHNDWRLARRRQLDVWH